MNFLLICKEPKRHGAIACNSNMSIHANPFRNTHGYADEYVKWEQGYKEAMQKKLAKKKGK